MPDRIFRGIKAFLYKEQFKPSALGLMLNPFFFARQCIYKNVRENSGKICGVTLDIGCGSKPYADLFSSEKYIGLDIETSGNKHVNAAIDVFYDGKTIPFEDNYFDSVVCFEVLEHVFNPDVFLKEAHRVLKPGGVAMFTVPFIWDEHEQPYDYARYSSFGLKFLFSQHGFDTIKHKKMLNDLRIIFLLINSYIYKTFKRFFPKYLAWFFIFLCSTLVNILGLISFILPKNDDLYFGNIFILRKL